MANEGPTIEYIDNPLAPDVFADDAVGWQCFGGALRITLGKTLTSFSPHHEAKMKRVCIGRLVMPLSGAESLARLILDAVEKQKKQTGHSASERNSTGTSTLQ